MNLDVARSAVSLLEAGERSAWANILGSRGSTPRHTDASMLVRADGSIVGTIGGGPLEAAVIQTSLSVLASGQTRVLDFETAQLGMMCGGGGRVLIECVDPTRAATQELFRGLLALLESGRKGWVVTVVPEGDGGSSPVRRCLVDAGGCVFGDPVYAPEILQGPARHGGTYDAIIAEDPSSTYVQMVGAQGTAYVFGAGHCGEKLVPVLNAIGFYTVIVDDRGDFANRGRFPTADRVVVPGSFDGVVPTLPIDEDSYLVIVTRGHAYDTSVLRQALRTPARYVGMIGSRKKVAETFRTLEGEGFSPDDLARVHAPIGLSIGAETPEEIAVSIGAELIQVRAGKGG